MKIASVCFVIASAAIGLAGNPCLAQWIDFSGISQAALPMTIDYGTGTVTVSQISALPAGTPELKEYAPGIGTQGSESPVGGIKIGIEDTSAGPDSWEIELAFSHPQQITINNTETYCDFEDTTLQSDGTWTQIDGSPNLIVSGDGTNTISLVGANGANGPFGHGHWTTTTTDLFMSYQLHEAAGGSAGNGIEIAVPEPASVSMMCLLCAAGLAQQRRRRSA